MGSVTYLHGCKPWSLEHDFQAGKASFNAGLLIPPISDPSFRSNRLARFVSPTASRSGQVLDVLLCVNLRRSRRCFRDLLAAIAGQIASFSAGVKLAQARPLGIAQRAAKAVLT